MLDEKQVLEYGCVKFEAGQYEEALEAFVLAYNRGYEQEWVIQNIYACYMAGNEQTFRQTFQSQAEGYGVAYEDCLLDFIPYKEGAYYIFDKEIGIFRGVFAITDLQNAELKKEFEQMEFSAAATEISWNWLEKKSVLRYAAERKTYMVCRDKKRCISFLKLPELETYAGNIRIFESPEEFQRYFHTNTDTYLPRLIDTEDSRDAQLLAVVKKEHAYRLTPEGRNTDHILLTIGIPTHDRGHLLLKRLEKLTELLYDAEIEFAVSKNGTHYFQEEYKKVETMTDARIHYVGYDRELTMTENWQNVIKIAKGKFVLLVSDEDDVLPSALEHYLHLLKTHEKELGMVRPKTAYQYSDLTNKYFKKGKEAFRGGFLKQNYLSGAIFNRKLFLEADMPYWDNKYGSNEFYHLYPHMWWQAVLSFLGDYAEGEWCLIQEGASILQEEAARYKEDGIGELSVIDEACPEIAAVSTYPARIEQFMGAAELLEDFLKLDNKFRAEALLLLVIKTIYLMNMVRKMYHYKEEEFPQWMETLIEKIMWVMERQQVAVEWQKKILATVWIELEAIDSDMSNASQ